MLIQNLKSLFDLERLLISVLFSILSVSLFTSSTAIAKPITVFIDEAKIVELSRPIAQVIIGNPAIADVTIQSKNILVFTGKSAGHTNIILLDDANQEILNKKVHVTTSHESGLVMVYRGSRRNSYHCGTVCNGTVNLGDNAKYTTNILSATDARLKAAAKAAKGN